MSPKQFETVIKAKQREIHDAIHRRLPVKIGRLATDHLQNNFRKGGYVDGRPHPWLVTRRQRMGDMSAAAKYEPLLSGRMYQA